MKDTTRKLNAGDRVRFRDRSCREALAFDFHGGTTLVVVKPHPILTWSYLLRGPDGYESWVAESLVWKLKEDASNGA